jgi:signal transduction histidine kinase/PAS domain-containing protein
MASAHLFAFALIVIALGILNVAWWLARRYQTPLVYTYIALLGLMAVWQVGYALQLLDLQALVVAVGERLHYSAKVLLAPVVLLFTLYLVDDTLLQRPGAVITLLFALPTTLIFLAWTDNIHHFIFTEQDAIHTLTLLYNVTVTPLLNLLFALTYGTLVPLAVGVLCLRRFMMLAPPFRAQVAVFALKFFGAFGVQIVYMLAPELFAGRDYTLLTPLPGVMLMVYSIRRYGLFRQMPFFTSAQLATHPHATLVLDKDHTLRQMNARMARILGTSERDALGCALADLLKDRPELLRTLQDTLQHNNPAAQPLTVHVGEELCWFRVERTPILPGGLHRGGERITLHNVTASYSHRPRITQSTYESMLNRLNEVVFEADDALRFTFLNAAWTRLTGITVPAALGTSLLDYVGTDAALDTVQRALQPQPTPTTQPLALEMSLLVPANPTTNPDTPPQREIWVACNLEIVSSGANHAVSVRGTLTDITERVLSDRALGRRDEILAAVRVAAHQFLSPGGWEAHIHDVLATFGRATGAGSVRLYRQWQDANAHIWVRAVGGWWRTPDLHAAQVARLKTATDITAFFTHYRHLMDDDSYAEWHIDTAPPDIRANMLDANGLANVLHVPVWSQGQIWGIIELGQTNPLHHWTAAERGALRIAADVIATAVDRQRDAELIQQQAHVLETVASTATDFLRSLDWRSRLSAFLEELADATLASRVYVFRLLPEHPGYIRILEQHARPPAEAIPTGYDPGFHLADYFPRFYELAEQGEPITLHVNEVAPNERPVFALFGIESVLWMPLMVAGQLWGTLTLEDQSTRQWQDGEVRTIRIAAQMLGSTIEQAQQREALSTYAAELEARNTELDTFSRLIAHDLKAPLSSMISMTDLIHDIHANTLPPMVNDTLGRINELGECLVEMIENLLWLARLRHDRPFDLVETDFALEAALGRYRETIARKQIQVHRERLPVTIGAQAWVTEVLANLISNAVKYMGDANLTPTIRVTQNPHGDDMVRICVSDNGIGIEPTRQAHIFELFTRVPSTEIYGHGLGLALVKQMVQKMGGDVGLQSTPQLGSTFWFTLPLYQG